MADVLSITPDDAALKMESIRNKVFCIAVDDASTREPVAMAAAPNAKTSGIAMPTALAEPATSSENRRTGASVVARLLPRATTALPICWAVTATCSPGIWKTEMMRPIAVAASSAVASVDTAIRATVSTKSTRIPLAKSAFCCINSGWIMPSCPPTSAMPANSTASTGISSDRLRKSSSNARPNSVSLSLKLRLPRDSLTCRTTPSVVLATPANAVSYSIAACMAVLPTRAMGADIPAVSTPPVLDSALPILLMDEPIPMRRPEVVVTSDSKRLTERLMASMPRTNSLTP